MADTPLSMTSIANALKYFYLDGLTHQINTRSNPFSAQLEANSRYVEGYKIKKAVSYGTTGGIGNRVDTGDMPTSNPRKFVQLEWDTFNTFARILITDKAIQSARSARGAFIQGLTHEMEAAEADVKRDYSRQVMGDGTGLLATISVVSSSGTTHTLTLDSAKWFYEGMLVDIYNAGDGAGTTKDTSEAEVTLVDKANNQIVLVATHTPVGGDTIYTAGNKDLELTGVAKVMTPDNTIYLVNRADNKWFNPKVVAVNAEISEVKIQEGIDDAEDETGNTIDLLMCARDVGRAYRNMMSAQKMIVNSLDLAGGWKAASFNGIPLASDKFIGNGILYAFSKPNWQMHHVADWDWLDEEGKGIVSRVSGTAKYEAVLRKYADLGNDLPRGQVIFTGITGH